MFAAKRNCNLLVLAPDARAQGGIAAVIENYKKTEFWKEFGCCHFSSCIDEAPRLQKIAYTAWRYVLYAFTAAFSRPRVVSIHTSSKNSFYRKFGYLLISRALFLPVVLHVHPTHFSDFYHSGGFFRRLLVRWAGRLSDRIVFLTQEGRQGFASTFPEGKLVTIPNPVDVSAFDGPQKAAERSETQVLFMGWIIREKGVYDILSAIPQVAKKFSGVTFLFAGNKEVDKLKQLIREQGLDDHARVLGWVNAEERRSLLRTSTVLLLPSYTEGIPNVVLEAMAADLPVITTPVGGIPSVITGGRNGVFVTPGNVIEIENAVMMLLGDGGLRGRLARAAKESVRLKYDTDVIGSCLRSLYEPYR